ncbi:hypothetical protein GJ744_000273 [Endocarpon pusillum]|uniref:Uncharacterized protein n=1 Tax=Endocarpon pusillum TaxID=364733 RepID=A0A8H7ATH2_9EURO|nr:hypothetical protein GJ744_000273 [Endocarpon pusillum]
MVMENLELLLEQGREHRASVDATFVARSLAETPLPLAVEDRAHLPEALPELGTRYETNHAQEEQTEEKENLNPSAEQRRKMKKKEYHQRRRREKAAAAAAAAAATAAAMATASASEGSGG